MGLIITGIGVVMLFNDKIGLNFELDPLMIYAFSGLCILYGGFRLYRGIKRDY